MDSTLSAAEKERYVESGFINMYTSLEEATIELHRRRNDLSLRSKVEEFIGDSIDIKYFFSEGPKIVYGRDIISPNHELRHFIDLVSTQKQLKPLFFEYRCGKMVAKNFSKYRLCKMLFHDEMNISNLYDHSNKVVSLIDFNTQEGLRLDEVVLKNNVKLLDFHHNLLQENIPGIDMRDIVDISEWFNNHRHFSSWYYVVYLSMFVCHGILTENFIDNRGEGEFVREKMLTSFAAVEDLFGVRPLIVPTVPLNLEENDFWWYYPESLKNKIEFT